MGIKKLLFLLCLIPSILYADTHYLGSGEEFENLQDAMAGIAAGDTLIIRDGTYTGATNRIDSTYYPPQSSTLWTTIKSQNDGGAIFDGEGTQNPLDYEVASITDCHWSFEGLLWKSGLSSTVTTSYGKNIKFLRCGSYDAGSGNASSFFIAYGKYVLLENCYAYGSGRYNFCVWKSSLCVVRSCVGRLDYVDAPTEPMANFSIYSCSASMVQNSIAIDSDQTDYYTALERHGGFVIPSTDMDAYDTYIRNSIALNVHSGGLTTTSNNYAAYRSSYTNCVFWDVYDVIDPTNGVNILKGMNDYFSHCTFGVGVQNSGGAGYYLNSWSGNPYDPNNSTIKNSIVYGVSGTGTMFYGVETQDYDAFYGNTINTLNNAGAHDQTATNFIWAAGNPTGALKYITRIEAGSNLSGDADDSGDIGANVKTLIGTAGTLWGETGYNTDTSVSMWPFPYESLIRTKMKAYSNNGVSGDRGFCVNGETLTNYIFGYLGNGSPYANLPYSNNLTLKSISFKGVAIR